MTKLRRFVSRAWPWLVATLFAAGLVMFALDCALGAGWVYR